MKMPDPNLSRGTLGTIAAVAVLGVIGGWWSWQQEAVAERADRLLRMQQTQWRALADSDPAPTAAVVAELERKVEAARGVVQQLRQGLGESRNDPVQAADLPAARADAFFALARFIEDQTAQAQSAEVILIEGESFGFSAYRNSGPADEHIEMVHDQMGALGVALAALWRAQPEEILQIQRENPARKLAELAKGSAGSSREGRPEDWLDWPADRSLARAGILDTLALRLSWVGHTGTLRAWLAELRRSEAPLIVREVAVEPWGEGGRPAGARRGLADLFRDEEREVETGETGPTNVVPLISENRSVFQVTLEYLDFDPAPLADASNEEESW